MDEVIEKMWKEHEKGEFPAGHRNKTIEGTNLTLIDTELSGFVLGFQAVGSLGARQLLALQKGITTLEKIIPQLESSAQPYFKHLLELSRTLWVKAQREG